MSLDSERRKNNRRWPLNTPWMIQVDHRMALMLNNLRLHWSGRFLFAFVISVCLGSVWWSMSERLPLVKSSHAYMQKVNRIQSEIDLLKAQLEQKPVDQAQAEMARFQQRLMPDMETMVVWLHDKISDANEKGMNLSYSLSPSEHAPKQLGNIRILPVMVILQIAHSHSGMAVASAFLESLTSDRWRVDMISLNMKGGKNGLEQVASKLHVWMKNSSELNLLTVNQP